MPNLGRIAALAMLPFLAGCFDYKEGFEFRSDGTVVVTVETAMSAEMVMFAAQENAAGEFCPATPEGIPAGFTAITESAIEPDGDTVCRVIATGPIALLPDALASAGLIPAGLDADAAAITLTNEGGGVYSFDLVFNVPPEDTTPPATPEAAALAAQMEAMETMIIQAMEGRLMTWSVTAPRIIDTDGVREGNTVTFSVPVVVTMTDPGKKFAFHVRFAI